MAKRYELAGTSQYIDKSDRASLIELLVRHGDKSAARNYQRYTTSGGQRRAAPKYFADAVARIVREKLPEPIVFRDTAREARRRDYNTVILRNEVYSSQRDAEAAAREIEKQANDPRSVRTRYGRNAQEYYRNRATRADVRFMLPGDTYNKFDSRSGKIRKVRVDAPTWRVVVTGTVHSVYEDYETQNPDMPEEDFYDEEFDDMQSSFDFPDDDE